MSSGVIAATVFSPMLVGGISKVWAGAGTTIPKPLWTALTGAFAATLAGLVPGTRKLAGYLLTGGVVAATVEVLNAYVVPPLKSALGIAGYGDYVQLPYSGYGTPAQIEAGQFQDYVQLPYSGMGSPAQVEAGQFQGLGDHDETGTFAPSF